MIPTSSITAWLIEATMQGSLATLLVAMLALPLRRWLGAQTSYWLWALVLFRLIVPGVPAFPIHWPAPSLPKIPTAWFATAHVVENTVKSVPAAATSAITANATQAVFPAQTFALSIWAAGVVLILGFAVVRSLRASRLARRARDISRKPELTALLQQLPLAPTRFHIRETCELRSPALCGLLRPIILLPLDWQQRLGDMELRCILLHEIGHFQRGDLLWRWAFFLVRAIHWFNPLVWIAVRLARSHQEMACDEWVVSRASSPSATLYGEVLLAVSTRIGTAGLFNFPVQAEMAESKRGLRRRIAHLATVRPHGWPACATVLLVALPVMAITGPVHSASSKNSVSDSSQDAPLSSSTSAVAKIFLGASSGQDAPPSSSTSAAKEASPAKLNVKIESRFVQATPEAAAELFGETAVESNSLGMRAIYSPSQFQDLLHKLDKMKGVDMMSAPSISMRPKQHGTISIVREFRYPIAFDPPTAGQPATPAQFETRPLGLELEVEPAVASGARIDIRLSPRLASFSGFINYGGSRESMADLAGDAVVETSRISGDAHDAINQPIFSVRQMQTSISLKDGQSALVGVMNASDHSITDGTPQNVSTYPPSPGSLIFVIITATLVNPPPAAVGPASLPTTQKPIPPGTTPYGTPVKGKPGFVTSPHAPFAGYVDVRGFQPNAEVKDPYTGKMFLVP